MDFSEKDHKDQEEIPEWRKELSRRLQEIKLRREERADEPAVALAAPAASQADAGSHPSALRPVPPGPSAALARSPDAAFTPAERESQPPKPPRRGSIVQRRAAAPRVSRTPAEGQATGAGSMPLFQRPVDTKPTPPQPEAVRDVIDRAVGRQIATSDDKVPDHRLTLAVPPGETAKVVTFPAIDRSAPDRLILLTRTLAGLVDLIIVASCTLGVLAATDFVAGIGNVDWRSMLVYSTLLILIFLLYSVFFLGTANQTIGMMITDLRVLDSARRRPGFWKVLARSSAFLVALTAAGIGLLWGCFDRECRCWHDRLSGTRVVRLS